MKGLKLMRYGTQSKNGNREQVGGGKFSPKAHGSCSNDSAKSIVSAYAYPIFPQSQLVALLAQNIGNAGIERQRILLLFKLKRESAFQHSVTKSMPI